MSMKALGQTLVEARKLKGWSLRDAEEKTEISNGYLSLLEQGKVREPSPSMLHKLAEAYHIEYFKLMELAGYLGVKREKMAQKESAGYALSSTIKELSQEEREAVSSFIDLIRKKNKVPN